MKAIRVRDADRIRRGGTAIMTGATKIDRYRIGTTWNSVGTADPPMPVDEIRHSDRHVFAVGDELEVKGIDGEVAAQVVIDEIELVDPARMGDAEFAELGYDSRAAYIASWGQVFGPRCWRFRVRQGG